MFLKINFRGIDSCERILNTAASHSCTGNTGVIVCSGTKRALQSIKHRLPLMEAKWLELLGPRACDERSVWLWSRESSVSNHVWDVSDSTYQTHHTQTRLINRAQRLGETPLRQITDVRLSPRPASLGLRLARRTEDVCKHGAAPRPHSETRPPLNSSGH